ncbi:squalene/phytoene synthase family protein [Rhodovulum sp. 12E13]|uniref:phytoene/squalene synthase family protein n=1 Tax=Rhodovulum sp. 12E13 TaxID=2203891 RepID=UPI000E1A2ADE|nr:squalene/phytoene synthase family protein [Rhodovulum sp. 12E13]RDC71026.1 squalene/phytoene synthase family protein [Rhodovulum sp. 12E13]
MSPTEAKAIMHRHARSFAPASRVLARSDRARVARLYALCRTVDDLADEDGGPAAAARLVSIERGVRRARGGNAVAAAACDLFEGRPEGRAAFADLVAGVRGDLGAVRIYDMASLEAYAHAVAGTVGIMVAVLFDVPRAWHGRAADLGRAMQLTNICRDVAEDARADRRYLPATLCDRSPGALAAPTPAARADVRAAVGTLLDRADALYASGRGGLPALPPRLRLAVAVSAALYRGIGGEIRAAGCDPLDGRACVPAPRKARLALGAAAGLVTLPAPRRRSLRGNARA